MRAGRACICALYGAAKCDSRRKRVAENREAQGIVRPCTLCFISPLWGGRRAQRSEHVGWGPPPEIASQFRPPHKGEVEGALIHSRFRDDGETLHPIDQKGNAKRSATFDRRLLSGCCTFDRRNADSTTGTADILSAAALPEIPDADRRSAVPVESSIPERQDGSLTPTLPLPGL